MNSHTVVHAQLTALAADAETPIGDRWDATAMSPDGVPRLPRRAAGWSTGWLGPTSP